jgi:hypothetical protein
MANEKHDSEDFPFDSMTDESSTHFREDTPPSTIRDFGSWADRRDVPCPEETFQIIEKHSGKAITLIGNEVKLREVKHGSQPYNHWHCIRQNGFFGFQNPTTGKYLGHDGKVGVRAAVTHLKDWELWTPREHRLGGYELLSPDYSPLRLMLLCVDSDGSLVRRNHGTALWQFIQL